MRIKDLNSEIAALQAELNDPKTEGFRQQIRMELALAYKRLDAQRAQNRLMRGFNNRHED